MKKVCFHFFTYNCLIESVSAKASDATEIKVTEEIFRFELNQDAMATEKLAEGIRGFVQAAADLEKVVQEYL